MWFGYAARCAIDIRAELLIVTVAIMHPGLSVGQSRLVAPLWNEVEIVIGGVHHVHTALVAGIGVEYLSARLLVEHAVRPLSIDMIWADLSVTEVGWSARERAAQSSLKRAAVQPKVDLHREPGVLDRIKHVHDDEIPF